MLYLSAKKEKRSFIMNIARPEFPNPQFERKNWMNLNGEWRFEFDFGISGIEREIYKETDKFSKKINVPFCPESELSGIGYKDFMNCVWYAREFDLTKDNLGGRVILHFGAVDFRSYIYVNGSLVFEHVGGQVSFSCDITDYVKEGENTVCVCAVDKVLDNDQPLGKQSDRYYSYGCSYTRTTGIWQTVWLEFVPESYIKNFKVYPDAENSKITIEVQTSGIGDLKAETLFDNKDTGSAFAKVTKGNAVLSVDLKEKHLWNVGDGQLYTLKLTFGEDEVYSYFGLRDIRFDGKKFMLNGKSVFQRTVLDQGFYPDGIYTARNADELHNDILRSKACGFNGARLHQKIFEPLFLYYCDKEGYLVWGEYYSWGVVNDDYRKMKYIEHEWIEELERDFNHPAIIGWCPLNEAWDRPDGDTCRNLYAITKSIDKTRPCIDTSGGIHFICDVFDTHDYEQDPVKFREHFEPFANGGEFYDRLSREQKYEGQPYFMSEYGGIQWSKENEGWGYGNAPRSENEFFERFEGLADALLSNKNIFALCYTQLTDVEQERNGLYYYDRTPKFDCDKFKAILSKKAAIED